MRILDKVSGSMDPQPRGALLPAASEVFGTWVCCSASSTRVGLLAERVHENVSVEASFGLSNSVESWDLLCGMKDGRWLVCPESVGFTAAWMQLLSRSL